MELARPPEFGSPPDRLDCIMSTRRFAVVITAFERPMDLQRALQSLAGQTFKDFLTIVCDDGSRDPLGPVVDRFRTQLDVQYIPLKHTGSPAVGRNVGSRVAGAEWVSFLDADDWWDSDRMETMVNYCVDGVDVVYHKLRIVNKTGVPRGKTVGSSLPEGPVLPALIERNVLANSGSVVRMSVLDEVGGVSEARAIFFVEDYDLWLRIAEGGKAFRFVDRDLGSYWCGSANMSKVSIINLRRHRALYHKHLRLLQNDEKLFQRATACFSYSLGVMARRQNMMFLGRSYLGRVRFLPKPVLWAKAALHGLVCSMHILRRRWSSNRSK